MKKLLELILLNLQVTLFNIIEYAKVVANYYPYKKFMKVDFALLTSDPFKTSKLFHQKRGDEEIYVYGETPLTSLDLITKLAQIDESSFVYDLGAGRGRGAFWLALVLGTKVKAIELIPEFAVKAKKLIKRYGIENLEFENGDFLNANIEGGTHYYLYGYFLSDEMLSNLAKKLEELPKGTKVISVSFPISDYSESYQILNHAPIAFQWGTADVYVSIRK
jgi:hypothetical protein